MNFKKIQIPWEAGDFKPLEIRSSGYWIGFVKPKTRQIDELGIILRTNTENGNGL